MRRRIDRSKPGTGNVPLRIEDRDRRREESARAVDRRITRLADHHLMIRRAVMSLPLLNTEPARTDATRWGAFAARHRVCAQCRAAVIECSLFAVADITDSPIPQIGGEGTAASTLDVVVGGLRAVTSWSAISGAEAGCQVGVTGRRSTRWLALDSAAVDGMPCRAGRRGPVRSPWRGRCAVFRVAW